MEAAVLAPPPCHFCWTEGGVEAELASMGGHTLLGGLLLLLLLLLGLPWLPKPHRGATRQATALT